MILFLGFIVETEERQIDDIVQDLMDKEVTTIVLTGKAGVGKTRMASEISKRAMEVGICFGTIWVFPNPGDLWFPDLENFRPYCVSIAHQLSSLSTVEEWEDHSTVIDENITVDEEKKATDGETGKSGDDTAFKDDEKDASEDSLKDGISSKLNKMRSDKLAMDEKMRSGELKKMILKDRKSVV